MIKFVIQKIKCENKVYTSIMKYIVMPHCTIITRL